jgi:hypothetical protein
MNSAAVLLPVRGRANASEVRIVWAYLGGTCLGSLLTVTVAWCLSGFASVVPETWRIVLLCAGAAFVWLGKEGPLAHRITLPESRRQIPTDVFTGSPARGAFRFGFELGTGVRTYASASAPYILLLVLLVGSWPLGWAILLAAGFGLGRAMPLMIHLAAPDRRRFAGESFRRHEPLTATFASAVVLAGALYLA